jgi:hypothetical protein
VKSTEQHTRGRGGEGVSLRAVVVALVLTVPNSYWLMINWGPSGYGSGQSFPTVITVYFNVVFALLLLLAWNGVARRAARRLAFSDVELFVIYILLSVASSIAGHDTLQILWPLLTYPAWFATEENNWAELFDRFLPEWLAPKHSDALRHLFLGDSSLYTGEHIRALLGPVLWWSSLVVVVTTMMLCLTTLIRRQWILHERLSYPVIQIPLQLTDEGGKRLFANRAFWVGCAIAGGMNVVNGIHHLVPAVPGLGGSRDLAFEYNVKPFTAIGRVPLGVYPFVIGLSYFIPLDLSFSIWFFFLFDKLLRVFGVMAGVDRVPGFPFLEPQSFGAWFALGLVALWTSRRFLAGRVRAAFRGVGDAPSEIRATRVALTVFAGGALYVLLFFLRAGIAPIVTAIYVGLMLTLGLAVTRVRAEVGPPSHDIPWRPDKALVWFTGTRWAGPEALSAFSVFHGFNRSYRSHPMPIMLEGYKGLDTKGARRGGFAIAIVLVTAVATVSSAWAYYAQGYHYGAQSYGEQAQCIWTYNQLAAWLSAPQGISGGDVAASLAAMVFTVGLMAARRSLVWWPFHPAGYALSASYWNTRWYWFSIFLSWGLKLCVFRVGGLPLYRRSMAFFVGLVIGEFTTGAVWTLIGIVAERPMYRIMW